MVNLSDVCAVPMLADMPDAKVDFGGESGEFGVLMQKSLAVKGDVGENVENTAQNRDDNACAENAEVDEKPDVSQDNMIVGTAAPVFINQQIIPTLEPSVVVVDLTSEAPTDVIGAVDGISVADSADSVISTADSAVQTDTVTANNADLAEKSDIIPDFSPKTVQSVDVQQNTYDVRADLPLQNVEISEDDQFEFAADAANGQISDVDSAVPTEKQSVPLADRVHLSDNEPIANNGPLSETKPLADTPLANIEPLSDYSPLAESKPLTEPVTFADTEQIPQNEQPIVLADYAKSSEPIIDEQHSVSADAYQPVATADSIDNRPAVEMFNRKVYLDQMPQENKAIIADNASDNSANAIADNAADNISDNIADVSAFADKMPIAADVKISAQNVMQKSDADEKSVNVLQTAEKFDAMPKIANDLRDTAATVQIGENNAAAKDSKDLDLPLNLSSDIVSSYSDVSVNTVVGAEQVENVPQAESVKNQIIEQIYDKFNAGETEFQIEIKPQELGTVTVKMAVKGTEMVIELIARDSRTQNIIISNSNEIKSILQDQLNHNVTVEVVHDENGSRYYDESDSQHAQPQQQDNQQQKNDDDGNNNLTVDFVTLMQMLSKQ